jgi:hypothetical protein
MLIKIFSIKIKKNMVLLIYMEADFVSKHFVKNIAKNKD